MSLELTSEDTPTGQPECHLWPSIGDSTSLDLSQGIPRELGFHFCPGQGHPSTMCWGFLSRHRLTAGSWKSRHKRASLLWLSSPHQPSPYVLVNPSTLAHVLLLKEASQEDKQARFLFPARTGVCQLWVLEHSLHCNPANSAHALWPGPTLRPGAGTHNRLLLAPGGDV